MSETSSIRVGIIGAGGNTHARHIPGLQAQPGVEILAVCNRTRESGQQVADAFGIPVVYDHWWEVTNAPDLDAVVIGTWPYMHQQAVVRALQAGKHVMVEARMAMNLTEARAMLAAAQANPYLVAQVVPSPMTLGVDRTIQRLLADGWLGELLAVEIRAGNTFIDADAELHWRQNINFSGLNIMSMGIWYEALMRWVGEATDVIALGKVFTTMRHGPDGRMRAVHIPDHIDVIANLACGAQLHLNVSSVTGFAGPDTVTLYGSLGTLRFTEGQLYGGQADDDALELIDIPADEAGGWRVEEEFIRAIRGLEPVTHTDFATGVKYMAFTEAVTRSMQERRLIAVESHYG